MLHFCLWWQRWWSHVAWLQVVPALAGHSRVLSYKHALKEIPCCKLSPSKKIPHLAQFLSKQQFASVHPQKTAGTRFCNNPRCQLWCPRQRSTYFLCLGKEHQGWTRHEQSSSCSVQILLGEIFRNGDLADNRWEWTDTCEKPHELCPPVF